MIPQSVSFHRLCRVVRQGGVEFREPITRRVTTRERYVGKLDVLMMLANGFAAQRNPPIVQGYVVEQGSDRVDRAIDDVRKRHAVEAAWRGHLE